MKLQMKNNGQKRKFKIENAGLEAELGGKYGLS
jgi:hypothetical protein